MQKRTNSRLCNIFRAMHARCEDPRHRSFAIYGGAGISVCRQWSEFNAFKSWAESAGYSDDRTIDRINSNLGYSPENCRRATRAEQGINRRFKKRSARSIGVDFHHHTGMFRARIRNGSKQVSLGYFHKEEDAAQAYRDAFFKMHGQRLEDINCPYIFVET